MARSVVSLAVQRLVKRCEIGAVVFVSFTGPARMPAAAATAQARLGLGKALEFHDF